MNVNHLTKYHNHIRWKHDICINKLRYYLLWKLPKFTWVPNGPLQLRRALRIPVDLGKNDCPRYSTKKGLSRAIVKTALNAINHLMQIHALAGKWSEMRQMLPIETQIRIECDGFAFSEGINKTNGATSSHEKTDLNIPLVLIILWISFWWKVSVK